MFVKKRFDYEIIFAVINIQLADNNVLHKYISIKKLFPFDQNYQFSHPLAARAIRDLSDCFVVFLATHRQASKKFFSKLARLKTTIKTINYYKKVSYPV